MAIKTIKDCITEVLASSGKPMSSKEIFEAIVSAGLYQFNTANPANVVRSQLRRHSKNIQSKDSVGGHFEITLDGKFKLAE
ncbi:winged helix-turn-helix domain-containing protein [bacterium]|nr:winged helix-turn-helix domain-containing protein [bacterium]